MQLYEYQFRALGGLNIVKIYSDDKRHADQSFKCAEQEVLRIEAKYSRYKTDSVLSQINDQAFHKTISVDQETAQLLNYAEQCFQESNGLFDITSGILRKAWNFKECKLPDKDLLESLLPMIGWNKLSWSNNTLRFLYADMQLDFGGIGKEYAVDRVCKILADLNIKHALVNFAGDLQVTGPKPDGSAWSVGVQHPRNKGSIAEIALTQGALATSGDYERYFELDGKRYCHIINPKNGWPVQDLQSVSVFGPSCLVAGSIATITMLLGEDAGRKFLEHNQVRYLLVNSRGELTTA